MTMQSKVVARSCSSASAAFSTVVISTLAIVEQLPDALALPRIVLDDEHAAQRLRELGLELLEGVDELLALDRLERVADGAALERLLRVVGDRDTREPGCAASRGLRLS